MHLLKVDEPVDVGLVPFVAEGHVLEQKWHEGHQRRMHLGYGHPVAPMVARRVDERLKLGESALQLSRQPLPRLAEPTDGDVAQAHHNGKERIQVLVLTAAVRGRE